MDFNYIHKSENDHLKINEKTKKMPYENSYIRRYILVKAALESIGVGIFTHGVKLLIENMYL